MSDFNSTHNRAVWFDIPVADLDRASAFYRGVLAIAVDKTQFNDFTFCLLEHHDGNGGCLILKPDEAASNAGILLYMNVNGRIRDAVGKRHRAGGENARADARHRTAWLSRRRTRQRRQSHRPALDDRCLSATPEVADPSRRQLPRAASESRCASSSR